LAGSFEVKRTFLPGFAATAGLAENAALFGILVAVSMAESGGAGKRRKTIGVFRGMGMMGLGTRCGGGSPFRGACTLVPGFGGRPSFEKKGRRHRGRRDWFAANCRLPASAPKT